MPKSPNFYPNRTDKQGKHKPEIIVLHLTSGKYDGAVSWLCNPASQASAHFVARKSDGHLERLVDDKDGAWTNGKITKPTGKDIANPIIKDYYDKKINPNQRSLTIEVEWFSEWGLVPVGSPLYKSLVNQVVYWCNTYGIPKDRTHIMGHFDIDPVRKPLCGKHIPWDAFIRDVQNYGKEVKPSPVPTPVSKPFALFENGAKAGDWMDQQEAYKHAWEQYNKAPASIKETIYIVHPGGAKYTFHLHPEDNPILYTVHYDNEMQGYYEDKADAYTQAWIWYNDGHKDTYILHPDNAKYTLDKHQDENPDPEVVDNFTLLVTAFNGKVNAEAIAKEIEAKYGVSVTIEPVDVNRK